MMLGTAVNLRVSVSERELGYLSNEVMEDYPKADMITLRHLLVLRVKEFIADTHHEEVMEAASVGELLEGVEAYVPYDLEGPHIPCNYCLLAGTVECKSDCPCGSCQKEICTPGCRYRRLEWGTEPIIWDRHEDGQ